MRPLSGSNEFGETKVPSGLSNVIQVAPGGAHTCVVTGTPACATLSTNTYCIHCAANGDRRTCVAAGQRCTVGSATVEVCSSLTREGGAADATCSLFIAGIGGVRLVHHATRSIAPQPTQSEETDPAAKCPAGEESGRVE